MSLFVHSFHYLLTISCPPGMKMDALSELFVEWNNILSTTEDKVAKLERERVEKARIGL
jgi:hypothetical protein